MVTLSQALHPSEVWGRCRDYSFREVPSVRYGGEAPDSVLLRFISNGNEIVHSPVKIGGQCNRRVAGSSPARGGFQMS